MKVVQYNNILSVSSPPLDEDSLRSLYLSQIDAKLHRLQLALSACERFPSEERHIRDVYRLFHNLAGSAGCYGFPQVSCIAQECMRELKMHQSRGLSDFEELMRRLRDSLAAIRTVFDTVRIENAQTLEQARLESSQPASIDGEGAVISILLTDSPFCRDFVREASEKFGFLMKITGDMDEFETAFRTETPNVLVLDSQGKPEARSALVHLRSVFPFCPIPAVLIGSDQRLVAEFSEVGLGPLIPIFGWPAHPEVAVVVENVVEIHRTACGNSVRDRTTGVYNSQYFREQLEKELRRSRRYHHPLSLAVLDIDHFANYNAVYGPVVGDEMLILFAGFLAARFRGTDLVARIHEDCFAVLMPESLQRQAHRAVTRMQNELRRANLQTSGGIPVDVCFSAGVANYPANADGAERLIEEAFDALRRAKDHGGGRVYSSRKHLA
ncbi:MAG: diguanylate cyclase domain-containing protein [Armatimonadota bacterium]